MRRYIVVLFIALGLVTGAFAQGRGGRGGGGTGGGAGAGGGAGRGTSSGGGYGSGMGQQTQQQTRQRIHASMQQQSQYQNCVQSSQQLRNQVRQMMKMAKKNQINKENATQLREQLRSQIRTMDQEHEQLMNGMNTEQSAAVKETAEKAKAQRNEIAELSDALDFELQQEELNMEKVKTQSRNMEASVERLQEQYRAMNNEVSLD